MFVLIILLQTIYRRFPKWTLEWPLIWTDGAVWEMSGGRASDVVNNGGAPLQFTIAGSARRPPFVHPVYLNARPRGQRVLVALDFTPKPMFARLRRGRRMDRQVQAEEQDDFEFCTCDLCMRELRRAAEKEALDAAAKQRLMVS